MKLQKKHLVKSNVDFGNRFTQLSFVKQKNKAFLEMCYKKMNINQPPKNIS